MSDEIVCARFLSALRAHHPDWSGLEKLDRLPCSLEIVDTDECLGCADLVLAKDFRARFCQPNVLNRFLRKPEYKGPRVGDHTNGVYWLLEPPNTFKNVADYIFRGTAQAHVCKKPSNDQAKRLLKMRDLAKEKRAADARAAAASASPKRRLASREGTPSSASSSSSSSSSNDEIEPEDQLVRGVALFNARSREIKQKYAESKRRKIEERVFNLAAHDALVEETKAKAEAALSERLAYDLRTSAEIAKLGESEARETEDERAKLRALLENMFTDS